MAPENMVLRRIFGCENYRRVEKISSKRLDIFCS
jgi:hypothetical protein